MATPGKEYILHGIEGIFEAHSEAVEINPVFLRDLIGEFTRSVGDGTGVDPVINGKKFFDKPVPQAYSSPENSDSDDSVIISDDNLNDSVPLPELACDSEHGEDSSSDQGIKLRDLLSKANTDAAENKRLLENDFGFNLVRDLIKDDLNITNDEFAAQVLLHFSQLAAGTAPTALLAPCFWRQDELFTSDERFIPISDEQIASSVVFLESLQEDNMVLQAEGPIDIELSGISSEEVELNCECVRDCPTLSCADNAPVALPLTITFVSKFHLKLEDGETKSIPVDVFCKLSSKDEFVQQLLGAGSFNEDDKAAFAEKYILFIDIHNFVANAHLGSFARISKTPFWDRLSRNTEQHKKLLTSKYEFVQQLLDAGGFNEDNEATFAEKFKLFIEIHNFVTSAHPGLFARVSKTPFWGRLSRNIEKHEKLLTSDKLFDLLSANLTTDTLSEDKLFIKQILTEGCDKHSIYHATFSEDFKAVIDLYHALLKLDLNCYQRFCNSAFYNRLSLQTKNALRDKFYVRFDNVEFNTFEKTNAMMCQYNSLLYTVLPNKLAESLRNVYPDHLGYKINANVRISQYKDSKYASILKNIGEYDPNISAMSYLVRKDNNGKVIIEIDKVAVKSIEEIAAEAENSVSLSTRIFSPRFALYDQTQALAYILTLAKIEDKLRNQDIERNERERLGGLKANLLQTITIILRSVPAYKFWQKDYSGIFDLLTLCTILELKNKAVNTLIENSPTFKQKIWADFASVLVRYKNEKNAETKNKMAVLLGRFLKNDFFLEKIFSENTSESIFTYAKIFSEIKNDIKLIKEKQLAETEAEILKAEQELKRDVPVSSEVTSAAAALTSEGENVGEQTVAPVAKLEPATVILQAPAGDKKDIDLSNVTITIRPSPTSISRQISLNGKSSGLHRQNTWSAPFSCPGREKTAPGSGLARQLTLTSPTRVIHDRIEAASPTVFTEKRLGLRDQLLARYPRSIEAQRLELATAGRLARTASVR